MSDLMLFFISYSISLFILSSFVIGFFRVIDRRMSQIEREMTMIVSVLLGRIQNENLVGTAPKLGAYSGKASELTKKDLWQKKPSHQVWVEVVRVRRERYT